MKKRGETGTGHHHCCFKKLNNKNNNNKKEAMPLKIMAHQHLNFVIRASTVNPRTTFNCQISVLISAGLTRWPKAPSAFLTPSSFTAVMNTSERALFVLNANMTTLSRFTAVFVSFLQQKHIWCCCAVTELWAWSSSTVTAQQIQCGTHNCSAPAPNFCDEGSSCRSEDKSEHSDISSDGSSYSWACFISNV